MKISPVASAAFVLVSMPSVCPDCRPPDGRRSGHGLTTESRRALRGRHGRPREGVLVGAGQKVTADSCTTGTAVTGAQRALASGEGYSAVSCRLGFAFLRDRTAGHRSRAQAVAGESPLCSTCFSQLRRSPILVPRCDQVKDAVGVSERAGELSAATDRAEAAPQSVYLADLGATVHSGPVPQDLADELPTIYNSLFSTLDWFVTQGEGLPTERASSRSRATSFCSDASAAGSTSSTRGSAASPRTLTASAPPSFAHSQRCAACVST